ncbi:uncharacterized protein FA14DRAFT_192704 [Meira miltonrushii]|uniref:Uncharacterized protein n=1 Tax=Meira miltonrushii TaxID=1280837 RepID=A0A316V283_9BASI|nr:uncharacterized protein FA14DRAFT_192704 [Meira miltonrushii]PWN31620.1 hypothetical protein FA14DRAFT_192704 [Meira miltonrushii]
MRFAISSTILTLFAVMTFLTIASGFPLPMEDNQSHHGATDSSPSKATKGVGNMTEMKYRCVQGMLHGKVLANKIGIQYEQFPSRFHCQPASERVITEHNVRVHKNKIENHQAMIKANRIVRAKAKGEKASSPAAAPDSFLRHGTSP